MILHKNKSQAIREFDAWAGNYDRSIFNWTLFRPACKLLLSEVRKRLAQRKDAFRLLDIGCGTGTFVAKCLDMGSHMELAGLDMAYNMIQKAREKLARASDNGLSITFSVGDAENLPFDNDYFDMVTCAHSFHHYPNQFQAIREMRRVIRPGGGLLIVDGHRDDPLGYLIFDVVVDTIEKHVRHCSRREFVQMFKDAGFRKVTQRMDGLFPPLLTTMGQA